ncbi:MFS transporter [Acidovorax sp. SRB_14]|uniref:tripartite tricarboxylate transporter substrate binding protein n=1 Tax=unclassified Acidovorax TaxID=2684926 RepID=UPI00145FC3C7|nr:MULTISPECIES: tripartite tricarboxylate transporter substrate binding protein [unclassified Acidovorax]NMM77324.1 MFS transporter [Acidovorax sp. SRB_24]NMM82131.1 MFS transporter [Acidovorax sp. SRB_14]NMM85310.1 MFS transporter [Rhodococcus sp. SRB_17]
MALPLSRRTLMQAATAGLASAALPALAQAAWPSKPIKIVVPYTAGGFTDQMARLLQVGLQKQLGQPVVIDNKPGANSIIGVDAVAKAAPDGHTFGVVIPAFTANTTLYPKLPYDPRKDLVGVSLLGVSPLVAAVAPNAPFKNTQELVAYAKAHPGKVSFASSGSGSAAHLTSELFKTLTKTYMVHIPYRGSTPALTDLMGGQVPLFLDPPPNLIQPAKAGRIRLIGVASEKRLPILPDVPTFVEQGMPGMLGSTWASMIAPAGTPREIVKRVSEAVNQIIHSDETRAKLEAMGTFAEGTTPEACDAFLASETTKWGKVIRDAGVKLD